MYCHFVNMLTSGMDSAHNFINQNPGTLYQQKLLIKFKKSLSCQTKQTFFFIHLF